MRIICKILLVFTLVLGLKAAKLPTVSVSIDPIAYMVKQIAGDGVNINVVIPPNADEHHLKIKPGVMKKLENSAIYFTLGLEFEDNLVKTLKQNYKNLMIVNLSRNIGKLRLGDDLDPHIWLDPLIAKQLGYKIALALGEYFPENDAFYKGNAKAFATSMDTLNQQIIDILGPLKSPYFVSFHPSWGYFAKQYKLKQIAVEEHGKEPKLKELIALGKFINKNGIKTIFIQDGFDTKALETIQKECKVRVVKLNHLEYDYPQMLLDAAKKIANSYN